MRIAAVDRAGRSLFFVLMPPVMAKLLAETGGGNPEPFLYVLLLWLLRDRPIAFGAVFAFGFMHREFTAYGVTAIIAIAWLADRRLNADRLKAIALAAIAYPRCLPGRAHRLSVLDAVRSRQHRVSVARWPSGRR